MNENRAIHRKEIIPILSMACKRAQHQTCKRLIGIATFCGCDCHQESTNDNGEVEK